MMRSGQKQLIRQFLTGLNAGILARVPRVATLIHVKRMRFKASHRVPACKTIVVAELYTVGIIRMRLCKELAHPEWTVGCGSWDFGDTQKTPPACHFPLGKCEL